MLQKGVYLAPSAFESGFVSTQHMQSTLDQTLEAAHSVISNFQT